MKETVISVIEKGLRGHFTHRDSFIILDGLSPNLARKRVLDDVYSTWEILYHTVFWQDLILDLIRGEEMDWKKAMKMDWPFYDNVSADNWDRLVERFKGGIAGAIKLLHEVDLLAPLESLRNEPKLKAFQILCQHNSYHLGQIVLNRRALETWSPSDH